ncbi:hypothetical protein QAD02_003932 [Eretmocerus hayati]|uniref:Uncharacterized protein n=1 Tax=Eretmocerus hayati TaxID=131215 RepID=A0ACC2NQX6_9HYME|nr:hypothetical protein QAD02_003932 [Eretmocerus hayati]
MERPIISTTEGEIQGITLTSILGEKYLAFEGIPYAQSPVGSLRFEKPQPPSKWSGVRDASEVREKSLQFKLFGPRPYNIFGDEDCLYLSVYTRAIGIKRPVIFYIHGGSYVEGCAGVYKPDYFLTSDLVYVSTNYRLGPMGFLNVGHKVSSGNQGLRDIIFALQWVQRNIEAFGGDQNNVTIFGNSIGSSICHLFTMIPAAKGLFHKAILQSGTIFTSKDLLKKDKFENGFKLASLLGMNSDDPVKVIEFLRTVPAKDLVRFHGSLLPEKVKGILWHYEYGPVFDADYTDDPLIPLPISKMLKNDSNIPIIIGKTSDEAIIFFTGKFRDDFFASKNAELEDFVRSSLKADDPDKVNKIFEDVKRFYLENKPVTKATARNLGHLWSDFLYVNPMRKLVDIRNKYANAPTYCYNFSYIGNEPTIYQTIKGPQPLKGVAHADELSYMFYISFLKEFEEVESHPQEGTLDRLVIDRFVKLWYNFAATGNPTPFVDDKIVTIKWKPSSKDCLYYLDMDEKLTMKIDENSRSRSMYEKMKDLILI